MRTVYIANDGTMFDDEWKCMDYEWRMNHSFAGIIFYDKHDNIIRSDVFSEETYNSVEKIVVKNKEALKNLHELADYTGFCCYNMVEEPGTWTFKDGYFQKEVS